MAYYRRRRPSYRRKRPTRGRTYRRKFRRGTRYNKRGQKVYLFKRHCDFGELTLSNITNTYQGYYFDLSQVPNNNEFTDLYDQYKINAVKITFLPSQTMSNSLSSVNNAQGYVRFFSAIDYNDSSAPTSIDELRQYQSCKYTTVYRKHTRYIRPKVTDRGSTYTPGNPWINTTAPTQQYFGLKVAVEPIDSTGVTSMIFTVEVKFYMSFKNVK